MSKFANATKTGAETKPKKKTVFIDADLHQELKIEAAEMGDGTTLQDLVDKKLRVKLKN